MMLKSRTLWSIPSCLSNLPSYELRAFVLDYLLHACYAKSARAFIEECVVPRLDADGDEIRQSFGDDEMYAQHLEDDLRKVEVRAEIRSLILTGRVNDASTTLRRHFPTVFLTESGSMPSLRVSGNERVITPMEYASPTSINSLHLALNLHILSFIEACRTVPLKYPKPFCGSQNFDPIDSCHTPEIETNQDRNSILLTKARELQGYVHQLPDDGDRGTYLNELNNIFGLLAYPDPEKSPISRYLRQERREAVADQIDRAILQRSDHPAISLLELLIRQTISVWSLANRKGVKPGPGAMLPPVPAHRAYEKNSEIVPPFDVQYFLSIGE